MPEPETPKPPLWTSPQFRVQAGITACILYVVILLTNIYALRNPTLRQSLGILGVALLVALLAFPIFQARQRKKYPPPAEIETLDPAVIKKRNQRELLLDIFLTSCLLYMTWIMKNNRLWSELDTAVIDALLLFGLLHSILTFRRKLKHQ